MVLLGVLDDVMAESSNVLDSFYHEFGRSQARTWDRHVRVVSETARASSVESMFSSNCWDENQEVDLTRKNLSHCLVVSILLNIRIIHWKWGTFLLHLRLAPLASDFSL